MIAHLHILGTSSAVPTSKRYPSAQLIDFGGTFLLFDCGEGTQMQLRKQRLSFGRIRHIFITHAHGDHFFGLIGLLSTMSLLKIPHPIHVYAPPTVLEVLNHQLTTLGYRLRLKLQLTAIQENARGILMETKAFIVETFPLHHSIPNQAFVVTERQYEKNIDPEAINEYNLTIPEIRQAKQGFDIQRSDTTIPNEKIVLPPTLPLKYAYCTDTKPVPSEPMIAGATLLYHEATFRDKDQSIADQTGHSTAKQAATSATNNQVQQLIIGHFSSRYHRVDGLLKEARDVFPNTIAAEEGMRISMDSKNETFRVFHTQNETSL